MNPQGSMKTSTYPDGPLIRAHKMTALPMDHPRHHAYITGFNDALTLADAKSYDVNEDLLDALRDLLHFAEVWQGSSVEIAKARRAILGAETTPTHGVEK